MNHKKIIELLRSGNFTLRYDGNGAGCLLVGKYKRYVATYDWDTNENKSESIDFGGNGEGYIPVEVEWLVEALGGKVFTI